MIVFDEIYPDKIVRATGDTNQLKNPENVSDIFKFKDYANHCIDLILEKRYYVA